MNCRSMAPACPGSHAQLTHLETRLAPRSAQLSLNVLSGPVNPVLSSKPKVTSSVGTNFHTPLLLADSGAHPQWGWRLCFSTLSLSLSLVLWELSLARGVGPPLALLAYSHDDVAAFPRYSILLHAGPSGCHVCLLFTTTTLLCM